MRGIDAESPQFSKGGSTDVVVGQGADERGIEPEVGQSDRHVGLAAAKGRLERGRLEKAFVTRRLETQHDLAKGYEFGQFLVSCARDNCTVHSV